ncbi:hypothetical protein [Pseudofrankia sp. BMG5.37]|uniref:hypothetical protein n=1 Tax=Pseudofrankia sp. BMG5.37 TaxID=3050035 RepID=UPI0018E3E1CB|nr:hypothetical protein [Pseudofrankia sp. BMG5.37]MDT3444435.1 hypothetical protein [Pseudofrankia sp. BMG5.37]
MAALLRLLRRLFTRTPAEPRTRCVWPDCAGTCPALPTDDCALGLRPPDWK